MFERFSDAARQVVVSSQEEAGELLHNYIGTEHLLLGLCRVRAVDPVLAATLPAVTMRQARDHVIKLVPRGDQEASGHVPFMPDVKKALELSLREAMHSGHRHIEAGHLLLALLDEPESVGVRVLVGMGFEPDRLRTAVTEALSSTPAPRPGGGAPNDARVAFLEEQVRRLTEQVDELRRRLDFPDEQDSLGEH
jgi:ATP-dependent Clp protease ATP-binding subunit ClpC